ncbi:unnamed protein product, partial [Larinioides sclopetarius]
MKNIWDVTACWRTYINGAWIVKDNRYSIARCDINCQNNSGFTVLHLASSRGNLSLVQYLLLK